MSVPSVVIVAAPFSSVLYTAAPGCSNFSIFRRRRVAEHIAAADRDDCVARVYRAKHDTHAHRRSARYPLFPQRDGEIGGRRVALSSHDAPLVRNAVRSF